MHKNRNKLKQHNAGQQQTGKKFPLDDFRYI